MTKTFRLRLVGKLLAGANEIARREGLTLEQLVVAALELVIARGSTR